MRKTYIIAEMAWAHDGSLDKAIKIMRAASAAGADAIGIHITCLEDYMVPYYGSGEGKVSAGREQLDIYKYLEDINLSFDDWVKFAAETRKEGIEICVMPNDGRSLEFAENNIRPELYAIAAATFAEEDFMREVASKGRRTLFRIGGAHIGEIERAVDIFRQEGNDKIVLLHGIQLYPTALEDTNLAFLDTLKRLFGVEVGLADHIDGGSPLAKVIPLLAIPYGATYIEKHITFNRDEKGEDFESALNPEDFKEFVELVGNAEVAIGNRVFKGLSEAELKYRDIVRKKIVAATDIEEGSIIKREHIAFKRCDTGLTPDKVDIIIGRKAICPIGKDDTITLDKLKG